MNKKQLDYIVDKVSATLLAANTELRRERDEWKARCEELRAAIDRRQKLATVPPSHVDIPAIKRDRALDTRHAMAVTCPECGAKPGSPCEEHDEVNGDVEQRSAPHGERFALGRERSTALSNACPTCKASPGVACLVEGKRGVHAARMGKK